MCVRACKSDVLFVGFTQPSTDQSDGFFRHFPTILYKNALFCRFFASEAFLRFETKIAILAKFASTSAVSRSGALFDNDLWYHTIPVLSMLIRHFCIANAAFLCKHFSSECVYIRFWCDNIHYFLNDSHLICAKKHSIFSADAPEKVFPTYCSRASSFIPVRAVPFGQAVRCTLPFSSGLNTHKIPRTVSAIFSWMSTIYNNVGKSAILPIQSGVSCLVQSPNPASALSIVKAGRPRASYRNRPARPWMLLQNE